jgi:hypothetical protein
MAALLQKNQSLAYGRIRVGFDFFWRLALALFERPAAVRFSSLFVPNAIPY